MTPGTVTPLLLSKEESCGLMLLVRVRGCKISRVTRRSKRDGDCLGSPCAPRQTRCSNKIDCSLLGAVWVGETEVGVRRSPLDEGTPPASDEGGEGCPYCVLVLGSRHLLEPWPLFERERGRSCGRKNVVDRLLLAADKVKLRSAFLLIGE